MQGQRRWLGPCRVGQSCGHGQKIQPWLVAFGIQLEGKGAAGGERDGQAGRKGAEKAPARRASCGGSFAFPTRKRTGCISLASATKPCPATVGRRRAISRATFNGFSPCTATKALFQKETAVDPQLGQGETPGEGGMSWLTARGSWPGWPPRTGCRLPSAGGCSPAHPTPPTSCRKRWRMSTSVFPRTENRPRSGRASEARTGARAPCGTGMLLPCSSNPGRSRGTGCAWG